jgi:hypothetical protein
MRPLLSKAIRSTLCCRTEGRHDCSRPRSGTASDLRTQPLTEGREWRKQHRPRSGTASDLRMQPLTEGREWKKQHRPRSGTASGLRMQPLTEGREWRKQHRPRSGTASDLRMQPRTEGREWKKERRARGSPGKGGCSLRADRRQTPGSWHSHASSVFFLASTIVNDTYKKNYV